MVFRQYTSERSELLGSHANRLILAVVLEELIGKNTCAGIVIKFSFVLYVIYSREL